MNNCVRQRYQDWHDTGFVSPAQRVGGSEQAEVQLAAVVEGVVAALHGGGRWVLASDGEITLTGEVIREAPVGVVVHLTDEPQPGFEQALPAAVHEAIERVPRESWLYLAREGFGVVGVKTRNMSAFLNLCQTTLAVKSLLVGLPALSHVGRAEPEVEGEAWEGRRAAPLTKEGSAMSDSVTVEDFRASLPKNITYRSVMACIGKLKPEESLVLPARILGGFPAMPVQLDAKDCVAETNRLALELIGQFNARLNHVNGGIFKEKLQGLFDHLAGHEFGSLEKNKEVARGLQSLLNRYGFRILCPGKDCGNPPAYLRCGTGGRAKHGTFTFQHSVNGQMTLHGGMTLLPRLEVVFAPISLTGRRPA